MTHLRRIVLVTTGLLLVGVAASADTPSVLPEPTGDVVLTISGAITRTNADGRAEFDIAMLEALGATTFETSTPWTDGVSTFEGVPGEALLEAVGASGSDVLAIALNDYSVTLPIEDFADTDMIVAYRVDGELMSVRDKGPLWIIFPFDDRPELRTENYYTRSIWQLSALEVE